MHRSLIHQMIMHGLPAQKMAQLVVAIDLFELVEYSAGWSTQRSQGIHPSDGTQQQAGLFSYNLAKTLCIQIRRFSMTKVKVMFGSLGA